jgi:hypothetical protein
MEKWWKADGSGERNTNIDVIWRAPMRINAAKL